MSENQIHAAVNRAIDELEGRHASELSAAIVTDCVIAALPALATERGAVHAFAAAELAARFEPVRPVRPGATAEELRAQAAELRTHANALEAWWKSRQGR
jgi:hypothetical protein